MSRHRTVACVILGIAGLLALAGCGGGGATLVAPLAPRLKVPTWAKAAAPLSEQQAARLIRDYGARRIGDVPMERDPSEVKLLFGAFTRPDASEAIAAVQTGLLGKRAWQAWLLEWRETGWQTVRPIASNCAGRVEGAKLDRSGPATLLMRDSCARFGHEEGQVRLIALGPTEDKVLFAAKESGGVPIRGDVVAVRHSVWLTGFDESGQAEVVDLAFTERRPRGQGAGRDGVTTTVTTYRRGGPGLVAVGPSTESSPTERLAASTW